MKSVRLLAKSLVPFLMLFALVAAPLRGTASQNERDTLYPLERPTSVIDFDKPSGRFVVRTFEDESLFTRKILQLENAYLENAYFKVVEDQSEQPLSLNDPDGRNVLFHLMRARSYFYELEPENKALAKKIIVRVRVTKEYNGFEHFSQESQSNNSIYVPADADGRWPNEMMFFQAKEKFDWKKFARRSIGSALWSSSGSWIFVIPINALLSIERAFDTAKTPSVIYHEAAHWASDDDAMLRITNRHSAVAEEYAHYFAASLQDLPHVGRLTGVNSRKNEYDLSKPLVLTRPPKKRPYNNLAVVARLLWQVRQVLGQALSDKIAWNSMKYLNRESPLTDVPKAIQTAAEALQLPSEQLEFVSSIFRKNTATIANAQESLENGFFSNQKE